MNWQGVYTALITPFTADGARVDEAAFESFIEWQVGAGVAGVVPCGTTGESATLTFEEHERVIERCVKAAAGRVRVLAGTGANATAEAIALTQFAQKAGASGALVVAPYYNKPTQEGLFQHFRAVHDACDLPIMVYNVPGRCGVNISDETIARLAQLPRIFGLKDATGDLARPYTLRAKAGNSFLQFSGEDMSFPAFCAAGGVGVISVSSNIVPDRMVKIMDAALKGDVAKARSLQDELVGLHDVMFCETSPGPVKWAAHRLGKCAASMRLPLVMPAENARNRIDDVLKNLHLI